MRRGRRGSRGEGEEASLSSARPNSLPNLPPSSDVKLRAMALHLSCFFPLFLLPRHPPLFKKIRGGKEEEEGGALMAQEGGSGVEGVAYWDLRGVII